jgi:UrcA family protein
VRVPSDCEQHRAAGTNSFPHGTDTTSGYGDGVACGRLISPTRDIAPDHRLIELTDKETIMNRKYLTTLQLAASVALRGAAAIAATVLLTVAPARADSEGMKSVQPLQFAVRYADLDLASSDGATTLYRRIVAAAHRVCPDSGVRDARTAQAIRECRQQAILRAVESVGSPQLAAVHVSRHPNG